MKKIIIILFITLSASCGVEQLTTNFCANDTVTVISGIDTTEIVYKICTEVALSLDTLSIDTLFDESPIIPTANELVLIVGGGQSNMVANQDEEISSVKNVEYGKMLFLHKENNIYVTDTIISNTAQNAGLLLFEIGLEYIERTGKTVILVNEASNSSSLTNYETGNNWSSSGSLRGNLSESIAVAKSDYNIEETFIIFSQGESDAFAVRDGNKTKLDYYLALQDISEWCFSNWQKKPIWVQTGIQRNQTGYFTNHFSKIRNMQDSAVSNGLISYGSKLAKYLDVENKMLDQLHYNEEGHSDLGKEVAKVISGQGTFLSDELNPEESILRIDANNYDASEFMEHGNVGDTIVNGKKFINLRGQRCLEPLNLNTPPGNYIIFSVHQQYSGIHFIDINTNNRLFINQAHSPTMYFSNGDFSASNNSTSDLVVSMWYMDTEKRYNGISSYLQFRNNDFIEQSGSYTKTSLVGSQMRIGHKYDMEAGKEGDLILGDLIIIEYATKIDRVRISTYLYNRWIKSN